MDGEEIFGTALRSGRSATNQPTRTNKPAAFGVDQRPDHGIDLNEHLVQNRATTHFFRMKGDAMRDAGIFDGDILIVDRSIKLAEGKIIVSVLNGELLVRRFHKNFSSAFLIPENNRYKPINLAEFSDFTVLGVVTYTIHAV